MFFSDVAFRPRGGVGYPFVSSPLGFGFLLMAVPMSFSRVPVALGKGTHCLPCCLSLLWMLLAAWWAGPSSLGFFLDSRLAAQVVVSLVYPIFYLLMTLVLCETHLEQLFHLQSILVWFEAVLDL